MTCYKCKYYRAGCTSNSCELFGFEYFRPYTSDNKCDLVNDDYTPNFNNEFVRMELGNEPPTIYSTELENPF